MFPLAMMFSNLRLQRTFGQAVANDSEIGGWFLCTPEPDTWPGKFSWRALKRALGNISPILFVEAFIIIPNEAGEPETTWRAWDFQKAQKMIKATAKVNGYYEIHFHTHPTGIADPSRADIGFAAACLQTWETAAEFVIVTSHPLRLWPYRFEWGNVATPDRGTWADGQFFSWYEKRIKALVKEAD